MILTDATAGLFRDVHLRVLPISIRRKLHFFPYIAYLLNELKYSDIIYTHMSKSTTLLSYKVFAVCVGPYRFNFTIGMKQMYRKYIDYILGLLCYHNMTLNQKVCGGTRSMNYLSRKFMGLFYELHGENELVMDGGANHFMGIFRNSIKPPL